MRWVTDRTGRFRERPHYEPEELDDQCESIISDFLRRYHGCVRYPLATDDLTRLIEEVADDLDTYADLSADGSDVEGVTDFVPGQRPRVRISENIARRPELENRLRTTLTHEFGHAKFHDFLFQMNAGASLFAETSASGSAKCKRTSIIAAPQQDWMEWQAGYACGAILMPRHPVQEVVRNYRELGGLGNAVIAPGSRHGEAVIREVAERFAVSREAARVRLLKLNFLAKEGHAGLSLFS